MASYNKVLLIGNLTKDPELRYTPQGTAVANLRLAVNRKFRNKNQELKEETCFITAVVWDKQAETCNQYLQKGSPVFVEGRLLSRSFEDASGQKRNVIEVRVERVQFLRSASSVKKTDAGFPENQSQSQAAPEGQTTDAWLEESEDVVNENQDQVQ